MAGTAVLAAAGYVAIEDIQKGDYVWSWDEETGEKALKQVTETYVSETDELVHLYARGEQIDTTPGHPFYVDGKGWYPAESLRAGDILVTINGERVILELVQHEILESPINVYNLEVQDYHTYYVEKMAVISHNSCDTERGIQRQKQAKMTNTQKIKTPSGRNRIPDYYSKKRKVMGEAKSVKYLTKSKQLVDMFQYAQENNFKMFLKIERGTKISKPLRQAIRDYNVYVNLF